MLKALFILLLPLYLQATCADLFQILTSDNHLNLEMKKILHSQQATPSFSRTHQDLLGEIYDIQTRIPSKNNTRHILKDTLGREPTMKEMLDLVRDQYFTDFLHPLEALSLKYPSFAAISDEVVVKVKHSFNHFEKNMRKHSDILNDLYNPQNKEHTQIIAGYISRGYGEIGEAISIAKTNNFIAHSMRFQNLSSSPLLQLIKKKVELTTKKAQYGDLSFLIEKYPHIFHSKTIKGKTINNPAEIVQRGLNWILTKEIDVVSGIGNGMMAWTEVKNYDFPFPIENLFKGHNRGHSVGDQLVGYLEIVDFLGLQDVVKIRVHFEGGIRSRARVAIEEMGILVI